MAIRPDYQTGTIDLVASSANFTTTGAALQMVAVQPGDAIITPSGHVLIIATITGQNSGTLFLPCPAAAAGTDLPLRIRFQPDGSRYQGAVRNLIDLLSSGNLEAFAALVGADGMVPIFTGPGTLDLVDPATFGIQDPNGSLGKLAALTLAARQVLQTDADGALKQVPLAANKFVGTDANGDLSLSDPRSLLQWNWIYNGDFSINQRGGPKKPANGVYGFDMWKGHANGIEQIVEALPAGEYTLTWSGGGTGYIGSTSGVSPVKATVVAGNTSIVVPEAATNVSLVTGDATDRNPWVPRAPGLELFLCQRYYETGVAEGFAIHRTLAIDATVSKIAVIFKATKRANPTTTISYVYQDSGSWIRSHNLESKTVDKAIAVLMTGSGGYCDVTINWAADASL